MSSHTELSQLGWRGTMEGQHLGEGVGWIRMKMKMLITWQSHVNHMTVTCIDKTNTPSLTNKCSHKEWCQRNTNDWGRNVDEPVGEKWSDSQKNNVVQKVASVFLDLYKINKQSYWGQMLDRTHPSP
jgi:hypothetical protein